MTTVYFQDPDDNSGTYLLESLLNACELSDYGGGAYAFASASGLSLLLDDDEFIKFVNRGSFELIIGVDAITDIRAIEKVKERISAIPTLTAKVFLTPSGGPIFHPKISWFRRGNAGIVITGSGNLTDGGLRGNWEAFVVDTLDHAQLTSIQNAWDSFKASAPHRLVDLDHPEVQRRAAINAKRPANLGGKKKPGITVATQQVLIAEIPDNNKRFTQANFHKKTFIGYFGAQPGAQHRVVFYSINTGGVPQAREVRPSVTSKSKNFRFELSALFGHTYPTSGRPIGVYVKISTRTFIYCVLFPNDTDYAVVAKYLQQHAIKKAKQVLEVFCTVQDLKTVWPASPLWSATIP